MPILRRAKVALYPVDLHHALNLRPDVQIMAVRANVDPALIEVVLYSQAFDAVTESEESPTVPLHTLQRQEPNTTPLIPLRDALPPPWKHKTGGPGQAAWTCANGHILAEDGEYNYHNLEWYKPSFRPPYGCKQCKRETVIAGPSREPGWPTPPVPARTINDPSLLDPPSAGQLIGEAARQLTDQDRRAETWVKLSAKYAGHWRTRPCNSGSTLDWPSVHRIRHLYFDDQRSPEDIAQDYAVKTQTIRRILRFVSWDCECPLCTFYTAAAQIRFP